MGRRCHAAGGPILAGNPAGLGLVGDGGRKIRSGVGGMTGTDDANDQLRRLFAAGCSDAVISDRMGVSRNSIIGRRHRLGLMRSEPRPTRPPKDPPKPRNTGTPVVRSPEE